MTYLPQLPEVLIQSFLYQTYFDRGKFTNIFIIYREQSITADERTFRFDQNEYRFACSKARIVVLTRQLN